MIYLELLYTIDDEVEDDVDVELIELAGEADVVS